MRKLLLILFINTVSVFCWVNPKGGQWITLDSLSHLNDQYVSASCYDSLNCVAIAAGVYIVHYDYLRKTTDGGQTWKNIRYDSAVGGGVLRRHIAFPALNSIVVMCDNGWMLMSSDAGKSWTDQKLQLDAGSSYAQYLQMCGAFGVAHYQNELGFWLTEDSAKTWRKIVPKVESKYQVFFEVCLIDSSNIYISVVPTNPTDSEYYYNYVSSNRGTTWKEKSRLPSHMHLGNYRFVDTLYGWANEAYFSGTKMKWLIYKTVDGGRSWNNVWADTIWQNDLLYSMEFSDRVHGVATRESKILLTKDGGVTWNEHILEFPENNTYNDYYASSSFLGSTHPVVFSKRVVKYVGDTATVGVGSVNLKFSELIHIVPNPVTILNQPIILQTDVSDIVVLTVYNEIGALVERATCESVNGIADVSWLISNLNNGLYYIVVNSAYNSRMYGSRKLVVAR